MAVQSVSGPVDAADLGFTYMHEHVFVGTPGLYSSHPYLRNVDAWRSSAIAALNAVRERGVRTIVDMTPADFHREPELVREAANAAGVRIIHATGVYAHTTFFFMHSSIEEIAAVLLHDIEQGMNGTAVRAGVLKAATGSNGVDAANERALRAIARVHRRTGVPIGTHTDMARHTGLEQQRIFAEEGVDLGRVYIGHSNDTMDIPYLEQVIERGSFISMDRFGLDLMFSEDERITLLVEMCKRGYADRIVVGHDANASGDWVGPALRALPHWDWTTIPDRILPAARARGVSEAQIQQITVDNPRRVFAQQGGY